MKLTKDNYEFLMFEMLEDNLNDAEKNALMEQINKDTFYKQEWILMQHTIIIPDETVNFVDKQNLLKPDGLKFTFLTFWPVAKIAASLLLIGLVGFWYYDYTNDSISVYQPVKNNSTSELNSIETPENNENTADQLNVKNRKGNLTTKKVFAHSNDIALIIPEPKNDTILPIYIPEIIYLKPLTNKGIAYQIDKSEIIKPVNFMIEKPKAKEPNKIGKLLVQADKLRNKTKGYWSDIPNLKLKITPKMKNHKPSIGFELKGETIYANALLELK